MRTMEEKLDLHGLTVDEAIPLVEKYIDSVYKQGMYCVWIVHGKGSGILRREIGRYLSQHPLVSSHETADRYHGGMGATRIILRDW